MPIFLLLFLIVPLVEIYLLIQVGQVIGALPTIALCILTAFVGSALLRHQGLGTLRRAQAGLNRGEVPALELFEGVALAVGGVLLLVPGFATDIAGLICLIPFTRRRVVGAVLRRLRIVYGPARRGSDGGPGGRRTIEGEFERRDRD